MRQFDVFENPSSRSRPIAPFVVVVQSHFLDEMPTALIAPLIREKRSGDFSRVSVEVNHAGETLYLAMAEMAPILRSGLKRPVGNLRTFEDDIRRASDRLFTGF